jgi:hypothetical protein
MESAITIGRMRWGFERMILQKGWGSTGRDKNFLNQEASRVASVPLKTLWSEEHLITKSS